MFGLGAWLDLSVNGLCPLGPPKPVPGASEWSETPTSVGNPVNPHEFSPEARVHSVLHQALGTGDELDVSGPTWILHNETSIDKPRAHSSRVLFVLIRSVSVLAGLMGSCLHDADRLQGRNLIYPSDKIRIFNGPGPCLPRLQLSTIR